MKYDPEKYQVLTWFPMEETITDAELLVETGWYWYACFRGWLHVTWNPDRQAVVAKVERGE